MNRPMSGERGCGANAVGWYGKLPGSGDFVTRRLPHGFLEPWDAWLRSALAGSRARLGAAWEDAFLSMPAWRFVLDPGVAGDDAWAGLLVPSVDAVGRYFPLTVACALPARDLCPVQTLWHARKWYDELETLVLGVIAPEGNRDAFDGELARRRFDAALLAFRTSAAKRPSSAQRPLPPLWIPLPRLGERDDGPDGLRDLHLASFAGPNTVWYAEASEIFDRCLLLSERLPSAEQFCALMNGKWADHGWQTSAPAATGAAAGTQAVRTARESV